jgi:outer membrane protein OmpA-like peptidoglycan-associated protein
MNRAHLFIASAMASALLINAPAGAQVLGGAGGTLGGAVGGTVGGVGGIGGDATVGVGGVVRVPATPRVRAPSIRTPRVTAPRVAVPDINVGVNGPGLGYLGAVGGKRRQALIDGGVTVLSARESGAYMDRQFVIFQEELAQSGVTVLRRGDDIVLQMPADVTFAFDKSQLQSRFVPVLTRVAATLSQFPATYVDVIGHADAIGSDDYNQALSERRAATVANFLVSHRAEPARLFVAGHGEAEPVASNATIYGRAANRRVEIILHPHA